MPAMRFATVLKSPVAGYVIAVAPKRQTEMGISHGGAPDKARLRVASEKTPVFYSLGDGASRCLGL